MSDWKKLVVRVWEGAPNEGGTYRGSAFFVSPCHLLTAKHVVEDARFERIRLGDGPWSGGLLALHSSPAFHRKKDVALLTLARPVENVQPIPLADGDPTEGETIILAGYLTKNRQLDSPPLTIHSYDGINHTFIAHTSVGNGMSGGPALRDGRLIGITQARDSDKNRTYIIPLSAFKDFLEENSVVSFTPPTSTEKRDPSDPPIPPKSKREIATKIAMLVDKQIQASKVIEQRTKEKRSVFVFICDEDEWPEALGYRLAFELSPNSSDFHKPDALKLKPSDLMTYGSSTNALQASLFQLFSVDCMEKLQPILGGSTTPRVFSLKTYPAKGLHFESAQIKELFQAWEQDIAQKIDPPPCLVVVVECRKEPSPPPLKKIILILGRWFRKSFEARYLSELREHNLHPHILPPPERPTKDHVKEWLDNCVPYNLSWIPEKSDLRRAADKLFTNDQASISHYLLGEKLVDLLLKKALNKPSPAGRGLGEGLLDQSVAQVAFPNLET